MATAAVVMGIADKHVVDDEDCCCCCCNDSKVFRGNILDDRCCCGCLLVLEMDVVVNGISMEGWNGERWLLPEDTGERNKDVE